MEDRLKLRPVGPASHCSVLVRLFGTLATGEQKEVGFATGFFYRYEGKKHLITNWHVVTGRNPDDPGKQLPCYKDSPTHFNVSFFAADGLQQMWVDPIPLYYKGKPRWTEGVMPADLVILPDPDLPQNARLPAVQNFAPYAGTALETGVDVVIVGFPFKPNPTNPYPVWKKAMISSEPGYTWSGKVQFLLDTPGREGMSGSPVYLVGRGVHVTHDQWMAVRNRDFDSVPPPSPEQMLDGRTVLEFIGIYSGALGDRDYERLNLGRAMPSMLIKALLDKPRPGQNPFPPEAVNRE